MRYIDCRHCRRRHTDRFLCDPARALLDDLLARGKAFDLPTVEFAGPPVSDPGVGRPGDVLIAQFVVKASVIEVEGVRHPAVLLTGRDVAGNVLPHWIHANTDDQLRRSAVLLHDMTELAISKAT